MKRHNLKKSGLLGLIVVFVFFFIASNVDAQFDQEEAPPLIEEEIPIPGEEIEEEIPIPGKEEEQAPPYIPGFDDGGVPPAIEGGILIPGEEKGQAPQYAPGEVLVKFKEGVDPQSVLQKINLKPKDIERVHSTKPAVARLKKDYKLEKSSDGWYWFRGGKYKEVERIPDEELFKEAYQKMSPTEKSLYRSYKITLPEGMSLEEAIGLLEALPEVEYAQPNYIMKIF